jgi:hypothetical protein
MGTTASCQTTAATDTTVRMAPPVVTKSPVRRVLQEKQKALKEEKIKVRNRKKNLAENENKNKFRHGKTAADVFYLQ